MTTSPAESVVERILDAAAILYAGRGPSAVTMNDVAAQAQCGRTTLYRHFQDRHALQFAYAVRESVRLSELASSETAHVTDPGERLGYAVLTMLQQVRSSPASALWYRPGEYNLVRKIVEAPELAAALTQHYLPPAAATDGRAEWLIRMIHSLLLHPPATPDCEKAFVLNHIGPTLLKKASTT